MTDVFQFLLKYPISGEIPGYHVAAITPQEAEHRN